MPGTGEADLVIVGMGDKSPGVVLACGIGLSRVMITAAESVLQLSLCICGKTGFNKEAIGGC